VKPGMALGLATGYRVGGPVDLAAHGLTGTGTVTAIRPGASMLESVVYVKTPAGYLHLSVQNRQLAQEQVA
jgi:hypothetical protein